MKMNFYLGKLGHEYRFASNVDSVINGVEFTLCKNDLVNIPTDENPDGEVYKVQQVLYDFTNESIDVFVKVYDWEE